MGDTNEHKNREYQLHAMTEGAQWQQKLWKPVVHNFTSYHSFPEKSEYTISM
jgi:hypothetical protein